MDFSPLKTLIESERTAALGTLHHGQPAVSLVPFALLPTRDGLVIHVSRLASHTQDMLAHPEVGLMVAATPVPGEPVHALPRASIQGTAQPCPAEATGYEGARRVYLERFPYAEDMFQFADFSLFAIAVRSVRFIGGFGKAVSITADDFTAILNRNQ
ncbi:HugZ family protein [Methylogaea oryzae]|uniref:Pyridoxamine 5'-phosphate oxidase n=1 Tax=Methylogaea oryzae TaxID=1295382 RepID=A0A8D5AHX8_9GAMM|nr:pyridoxamine 5'-phosphate oxidase family protein [Methylogaea oryzae]BBL71923.1 pyridoxamine 5'-phosphate oxidase [Methylogaea oryzae]